MNRKTLHEYDERPSDFEVLCSIWKIDDNPKAIDTHPGSIDSNIYAVPNSPRGVPRRRKRRKV